MRIFLVPVNGRKIAGFTLMEMMTAVAVAAILVVIAYPAYQSYIRKTRLNKSLTAMMDNSQFLERYYANHYNFKKNSTTWADIPHTETEHFYNFGKRLCDEGGGFRQKCRAKGFDCQSGLYRTAL